MIDFDAVISIAVAAAWHIAARHDVTGITDGSKAPATAGCRFKGPGPIARTGQEADRPGAGDCGIGLASWQARMSAAASGTVFQRASLPGICATARRGRAMAPIQATAGE